MIKYLPLTVTKDCLRLSQLRARK